MSEFLKKIATLLTGNLIAQGTFFLASIVLARLYTPEQFGGFAYFLSLLNFAAIIFTLNYEYCLVLPREAKTANQLLQFSLLLGLSFLILGVFVLAGMQFFFSLTWHWWLALLMASWASGIFNIFNFYFLRLESYQMLSATKVIHALAISFLQFAFFKSAFNHGLIWGYLLGLSLAVGVYVYALPSGVLSISQEFKGLLAVAKKYFPIIKYSVLGNLVSNLTINLLPIFIYQLFTAAEAGYFFIMYRVIWTPMSLLYTSVAQVFYREIAQLVDEYPQRAFEQSKQMVLSIFILTVLGMMVVFGAGEYLFGLVFGTKWRIAGLFAIYMIPFFIGKAIYHPISYLAEVLKETRMELILKSSLLLGFGISAYIGKVTGDILIFIQIYAWTSGLLYGAICLYFMHRLYQKSRATLTH